MESPILDFTVRYKLNCMVIFIIVVSDNCKTLELLSLYDEGVSDEQAIPVPLCEFLRADPR